MGRYGRPKRSEERTVLILNSLASKDYTYFTVNAVLVRETPTLNAYRYTQRGCVNLVAHCCYCRTWHFHGAGRTRGAADGHRVAHCYLATSPYQETGYYLHEVGVATPEVRRDVKRRHARGVGGTR
jgi:hypothetical protein